MEEADRGEQAALLYLLELTNMEAHNLYMEFEQEMPKDIEKEYEAGIQTGRRAIRACAGL